MGKKKKRSPAPPPAKTYTQAEVDKLKSDWQAKSQTDYDTRLAGQKDLWGAQEAQRKAEAIRGQGDGLAITIYSNAFGRDKQFFKFYRSMQAYEKTFVDKDTTMILSPESEFFNYFGDKKGNKP